MPANPYRAALRQAQRDNRYLKKLFDSYIGSAEHPRGRVLTAYRHARAQIAGIAATAQPLAARYEVREILRVLGGELRAIGQEALDSAASRGQASAQAQVAAYAKDGASIPIAGERLDVLSLLDGWIADYTRQATAANTALALGDNPSVLVGDAVRPGILQPAPIAKSGANWFARAMGMGMSSWIVGRDRRPRSGFTYSKQAMAAIDEVTTDCCLRVHGQVVPFEGDFELTGTPRFADEAYWSPFHWYCRTSCAMYHKMFEEGETAMMERAADAELEARAGAQAHVDEIKQKLADLGQRPDIRIRKVDTDEVKSLRTDLRMWKGRVRQEIHPAHATSRRGAGSWRWGP